MISLILLPTTITDRAIKVFACTKRTYGRLVPSIANFANEFFGGSSDRAVVAADNPLPQGDTLILVSGNFGITRIRGLGRLSLL